jgi:hypothetical protein
MFGINATSDGSGDLGTINGVPGTMTEGMSFNYEGDNNWIDHLEASGSGMVILNNESPAYACAVSNDGGMYKTIGVSFEYGGLDELSKTTLMESYLEFFEILGSSTMSCNMSADPNELCEGESSQLNVVVYGGSGNYEYLWAPATGLSDPTIANPVATPTESIMYTVTISDMISSNQVVDEMMLAVYEIPETPVISQIGLNLASSVQFGNQWHNDNGEIPGATGQIFSPTETGNYYTIITSENGCESEMSNVIFFQATFLEELTRQGSLRVYPNPASNRVNLDFISSNSDRATIAIMNAYGQLLYFEQLTNLRQGGIHTFSLNMENFDAGVYYIQLQDTEKNISKKIILSK